MLQREEGDARWELGVFGGQEGRTAFSTRAVVDVLFGGERVLEFHAFANAFDCNLSMEYIYKGFRKREQTSKLTFVV